MKILTITWVNLILTADNLVFEYLNTYTSKIKEYMEDLKNHRGAPEIDMMEPNLEHMMAGGDDDQIIDPNHYIDRYVQVVNIHREAAATATVSGQPAPFLPTSVEPSEDQENLIEVHDEQNEVEAMDLEMADEGERHSDDSGI